MLDDLYSRLTAGIDYKQLIFLPIMLTIVLVGLVYFNGIPQGIDFRGGTWVEVIPENTLSAEQLDSLTQDLASLNLEDLEVYSGKDIVSGKEKVTMITTSQVNQTLLKAKLKDYIGDIYEIDSVRLGLEEDVPADVKDKLASRFSADVFFEQETNTLVLNGFDLDQEQLASALEFYLGEEVSFEVQEKNINIKPVGETLGKTFREQGVKAAFLAYLLIISVIFFAFRDLIPSLAVILAGTCDALIALGGMSLFGIVLEPASLVALLMLVGYSVDSDILLTTRVLKTRTGTVMDRINDAMKTGLTMTGTTIVVMIVIIVVSTTLFQIEVLTSIASVLLLGLIGDLTTTWFMNAGILRWYVEEKGGRLGLRKSLRNR